LVRFGLCAAFALSLVTSCRSAPDAEVPGPSTTGAPTGTPTGTVTGIGTTTGSSTGTTTGTTVPSLCDSVLPGPGTWTKLDLIPPSEEFAFDTEGNLINIDDLTDLLFESPYFGAPLILAPYVSPEVGAVRFMLDGDLVVADEGNGALMRLGLNGSTDTLLGSIIEPNSVAVHRDGTIYTTAADQIWRVDPNGIDPAVLEWTLPGADLDGLAFSVDYDWLFFNSDEDAMVGKSRVNADRSLEPPIQIANLVEGQAELDGQAVDACNNLYSLFTDGRIQRIWPDGTVEDWLTISDGWDLWTTALHFGSGIGGFKTDYLYIMNRDGGVYEAFVGVEGRPEPHYPSVTGTTGTTP